MTTTLSTSRVPSSTARVFAAVALFVLGACDGAEETKAKAAAPKTAEATPPAKAQAAEPKAEAKAAEAKPAPEPAKPPGPKIPDDGCKLFAKGFVDIGKYTKAEHKLEAVTMDAGSMFPGTLAGVGCEVKRTDNESAVLTAYYFPTEGDAALKSVESKIKSFPEVKLGVGKAAALMAQANADKLYPSGDIRIVHDAYALLVSWRPTDEPPLSRAFMLGLANDVSAAADAATN